MPDQIPAIAPTPEPDPLRRALLLGAPVGLLLPGVAGAKDRPSRPLPAVLPKLKPEHPRILIDAQTFPRAIAAAKTDPVRARFHARLIEEADVVLGEPTVGYKLNGTRPSMLGGSRRIIRHVLFSATACHLTGDRKYADRAIKEILGAASFPEWNHSHFLDVAETSFAVAIGYDWLNDLLSEEQRDTVRAALAEKALLWGDRAYREPDDQWLSFPTFYWNWNQVCNGGLLAAALAIAEAEPQLSRDVINGVIASVPTALAAYDPDGAGREGPVYWTYGTSYHVLILAMLRQAMGSTFKLGDSPAFRETELYRLHVEGPTGKVMNYGDCKPFASPTAALGWLGMEHGHAAAVSRARADMVALMEGKLQGEFDRFAPLYALWYPAETAAPPLPTAAHFRGEADLVMLRSAWTRDASFIGLKGGSNKVSHGHLDLGSFVLEAQGVRWAEDLGGDSYDIPTYFQGIREATGGRFKIFRISARSHATLVPEAGDQFPLGKAPITRFVGRPGEGFAICDLTAVYPGMARSIRRGVRMQPGGRTIVIRDEIVGAKPGSRWRWAMPTLASVATEGGTATLALDGKRLLIAAVEPGLRFVPTGMAPPTSAENPNTGYTLLAATAHADAAGRATITMLLHTDGVAGAAPPDLALDRWI